MIIEVLEMGCSYLQLLACEFELSVQEAVQDGENAESGSRPP